jgi:hypothetical protein
VIPKGNVGRGLGVPLVGYAGKILPWLPVVAIGVGWYFGPESTIYPPGGGWTKTLDCFKGYRSHLGYRTQQVDGHCIAGQAIDHWPALSNAWEEGWMVGNDIATVVWGQSEIPYWRLDPDVWFSRLSGPFEGYNIPVPIPRRVQTPQPEIGESEAPWTYGDIPHAFSPGTAPEIAPPPWRDQPNRIPDPARAPSERTERGPDPRPRPDPRPSPWTIPRVEIDLTPRPGQPPRSGIPQPKPNPGLKPPPSSGAPPITRVPPRPGPARPPTPRKPPEKGTKEKKIKGTLGTALRVIGMFTEALDLNNALYRALPEKRRPRRPTTQAERIRLVYTYWGEISVQEAVWNVARETIQDSAIGRASRAARIPGVGLTGNPLLGPADTAGDDIMKGKKHDDREAARLFKKNARYIKREKAKRARAAAHKRLLVSRAHREWVRSG